MTAIDIRSKSSMAYAEYRDVLLADISPDCPLHLRDVVADNHAVWEMYDGGVSVNDALVRLHYRAACRKANRNA